MLDENLEWRYCNWKISRIKLLHCTKIFPSPSFVLWQKRGCNCKVVQSTSSLAFYSWNVKKLLTQNFSV